MPSFLDRLFRRTKKGSGSIAKDRLRFVLQHDRINLSPERMEEMKQDILAVIVKYLVIDQDRVEIALEQRDPNHSKLIAEFPFVKGHQPVVAPQPAAEAKPEADVKSDADDAKPDDGDKKRDKDSS